MILVVLIVQDLRVINVLVAEPHIYIIMLVLLLVQVDITTELVILLAKNVIYNVKLAMDLIVIIVQVVLVHIS